MESIPEVSLPTDLTPVPEAPNDGERLRTDSIVSALERFLDQAQALAGDLIVMTKTLSYAKAEELQTVLTKSALSLARNRSSRPDGHARQQRPG